MSTISEIRRSGLMPDAAQRRSPNCDQRPPDARIDLLVIHNISLPPGEFGGDWIDDLFHNRLDPAAHTYFREIAGLEVSSHLLVRRDGDLLQYVPLHLRASPAVTTFQSASSSKEPTKSPMRRPSTKRWRG